MTETVEQPVVEPVVEPVAEDQAQEPTTTSQAIHQRAFSIHIDNPLEGTPTCTFQQEKVVVIDGEVIKQPIGELVVAYDETNPDAVVLYDLLKNYYLNMIAPPVAAQVEEPATTEEPAPPVEEIV
jgi:hypothetical protein